MNNKQSWIDQRFPLTKVFNEHLAEYYTPRNFNIWYFFGGLAILMLGMQLLTGIFLTMNYKPDAEYAFASVEYIMRDVEWGWFIRYLHSTGASAFFIIITRPTLLQAGGTLTVILFFSVLHKTV